MKPAIVILTFNSSQTISQMLARAFTVSDEVFVVDSFSSDNTLPIGQSMGATVCQHAFQNYGAQRNWAIDSLQISNPWQLHLDADEWMDDTLINAIRNLPSDTPHNGFLIPRYLKFLGRLLKHGALSPTWHLRLFKTGIGRCEERQYDQHFYLASGAAVRLPGRMIDTVCDSLSEWTSRHNRWADAEVAELVSIGSHSVIQPNALGNAIEQKRYWRARYNSLPLFIRPFCLFIYRYIFRLGFLDGKEGFVFWILQTFWFRFLIDAKIFELRKSRSTFATANSAPDPVQSTPSV